MDRPQSVTRALVNMAGAAVAFAILNAAVKSLRGEIPTVQLVWVRTLGHLLFVGAAITGYLVFHEVPGAGVWIGAALIVASGLFLVYAEGRARRL